MAKEDEESCVAELSEYKASGYAQNRQGVGSRLGLRSGSGFVSTEARHLAPTWAEASQRALHGLNG